MHPLLQPSLDVLNCEIVQTVRLFGSPPSTVERVSYVVPRVKSALFHDDLFPLARSDEATYSSREWFASVRKPTKTKDLQPRGTRKASEEAAAPKVAKYNSKEEAAKAQQSDLTRDEVFSKFYDRMKVAGDEQYDDVDKETRKKAEESGWAVKEDEWD